jgi:SAM-dependent methyltransferase
MARWLNRSLRNPGSASNKFEDWLRRNPTKSFKDFYSERNEVKLHDGQPHGTLGGNLYDEYGGSGKAFFQKLVNWGLKPNDTCVDYGCGTLRLGIHAITYLKPGAYWGLDVSDRFLQEGRKLVGDRMCIEKQPNLRVISPESVTEVAATRPAMLFSVHVLKHVHPDELQEYFQNVIKIIGPSGQAIIVGKWSDSETIQYSAGGWAHAFSIVQDVVKSEGGRTEVIREQKCALSKFDKTARKGMLRVVSCNGIA